MPSHKLALVETLTGEVEKARLNALVDDLLFMAAHYSEFERNALLPIAQKRQQASKQQRVAIAIEKHARQLRQELSKACPLLPGEWSVSEPLPYTHTLAGLAKSARDGTKMGAVTVAEMLAMVNEIQRQAERWKRSSATSARSPRGRKTGIRLEMATLIAQRLSDAGIPLRKNPNGLFAQVLEWFYKAIGLPNKKEVYRDVAKAIDWLRRRKRTTQNSPST